MSESGWVRLAIVGPILPFRGGIAQHTTMVHRTASASVETLTLSFTRQYPAWLFPGQSDQDPNLAGHREPGVDYCLDSLNPLTWRRAFDKIKAFAPDLVVIPWWTVYWAPMFGYLGRRIRQADLPLTIICHNAVEHEAAAWKRWLSRLVLRRASGFLVHTRVDQQNLRRLGPGVPIQVHPHPIFEQFPVPQAERKLPRRRELELLFFGFVRPYKGLDVLIEAMQRLAGRPVMLTIAGEFWRDQEETRQAITNAGIADQTEFRPGFHSERDSAELFARADCVVLPYRSATGSGIVPLAYHYGKPVLATRVGGLPDVVEEGRTGFLVEPEDPDALAEMLRGLSADQCAAMRPAIERIKQRMTWSSLVDALLETPPRSTR